MSGDHCNTGKPHQLCSDDAEHQKVPTAPSKHGSSDSNGASGSINVSGSPATQGVVPDEVSEVPKMGKLSKNALLDSEAFKKTIAMWFGEKGFIAMRSFFRASVLNSLQKDPMSLNQASCSDLDAVIVTLIADYLVKNGKYFTMSVFSNEVLRPLANSNPNLKQVMQRIGKCEDLGEPTLTRETVSFVMRTLNVQTHSMLGTGILHKYLDDRADLLSVFMSLLRDNAPNLNVKERAVRDDDVIAALSEGLQEEMGKLHGWFANFNSQFVDVSGKLKKLICSKTAVDGVGSKNVLNGQDEQELWNQMVRMDEHLKKQQECLMKMRDREKKKLASYAKELEDLHQEMNLKLKSIQDYEKTLKIREKVLREREAMGVTSAEHHGRGDCEMADIRPKRGCQPDGINTFKQSFDAQGGLDEGKLTSMTGRIMEENLELKAILREQNLRIDALTKKAALLMSGCYCYGSMTSHSPVGSGDIVASNSPYHTNPTSREPAHPHQVLPPQPPQLSIRQYPLRESLVSAMSSALRRARVDIDSLRDEQTTTDLQYDRLLHNKLSKRL